MNQILGVAAVRSTFEKTPMLSGVVSNTTGAWPTSVPRRHSLIVRA